MQLTTEQLTTEQLTTEQRQALMDAAAKPVPKTQIERIRADCELATLARAALPAYEEALLKLERQLQLLNRQW